MALCAEAMEVRVKALDRVAAGLARPWLGPRLGYAPPFAGMSLEICRVENPALNKFRFHKIEKQLARGAD